MIEGGHPHLPLRIVGKAERSHVADEIEPIGLRVPPEHARRRADPDRPAVILENGVHRIVGETGAWSQMLPASVAESGEPLAAGPDRVLVIFEYRAHRG